MRLRSLELPAALLLAQRRRQLFEVLEQALEFGTAGHRRAGLFQVLVARQGQVMPALLVQERAEHLQVAQRRGQLPDLAGGLFQRIDPAQPAQGSQQAAQPTHRGAQIVQGFAVGRDRQARLAGQQLDFKRQNFGNQMPHHR